MLPGSRTRDVIYNAAHCRIPLGAETLGNGFPPSPRATTRPTARFIKDNIVLCVPRLRRCHTDGSAVPGGRATARGAAIGAPACRHPSRQPPAAAMGENMAWPAHPGCSPPPLTQGAAPGLAFAIAINFLGLTIPATLHG